MSISLRDMENEVRTMNGIDISLDKELGNIIELNDINDSLGLNMLTNTHVPSNNRNNSSSGLAEVEVTNFDPIQPISLNFNDGPDIKPINIEINREPNTIFSNNQSSSAPSMTYESAQSVPVRIPSESEKKEKIEILNKLQRLEQKGFPVSRRYTMDNSLEEMKDEYERLLDARNLEASLRFQRQALMGIVTGLEWANGKFDPFDLKLDGWSESVHENAEDFDDVFEELYDKYKDKGKMPPEARLIFSLAGSGFMCHVSNTFLRSRMPNVDDVLRNNPDLARQVAGAAASAAGPGFGNFMNMAMGSPQQQQQMPQQMPGQAFNVASQAMRNTPAAVASVEPPSQQSRREMKGPSGVDDILRTFEEARRNDAFTVPEAISSVNQPASAAAMELQSLHSEEFMSQAESTKTGGARGGGRRKRQAVGNSISIPV
jgi:hypothetical protein